MKLALWVIGTSLIYIGGDIDIAYWGLIPAIIGAALISALFPTESGE